MAPKKAIIIILLLFLAVATAFAVLYVNKKQALAPSDGLKGDQTGVVEKNESAKPVESVEEKINKIVEAAKQNPKATPDTVRQEVVSAINADIIQQEQNKTPAEKAADLKAREERQRIIDEINNKIKSAN